MKKLLNYLFIACAALALLLAFGYVAVEMAAVITGNGSLTIWRKATWKRLSASCVP